MTFEADCRRVLDRISELYRASAAHVGGAGLMAAAQALDTAAVVSPPKPRGLPVGRYLNAALASARGGPLAGIAETFGDIADRCAWSQNPNYVAHPPSATFLDRYGYVELMGPGRAVPNADVRVGLLMLGPETDYPPHLHPAEEVYHVVGGRAAWWRDGVDWHVESPGAAIHHAPHVPHATRCTGEPLLALYCWTGDIEAAAQLV
jgi:mannose-6-phosphate isomerase-like protein (cupin superfamily)